MLLDTELKVRSEMVGTAEPPSLTCGVVRVRASPSSPEGFSPQHKKMHMYFGHDARYHRS